MSADRGSAVPCGASLSAPRPSGFSARSHAPALAAPAACASMRRYMSRSTRAALGVFLLLGGCTAIVDADQRKLGPSPCNPSAEPLRCVCLDGTQSIQTCNASGRYEACRCPTLTAGSGAR